eukprot:365870-Chlamydomonas_euryale.AAC.2
MVGGGPSGPGHASIQGAHQVSLQAHGSATRGTRDGRGRAFRPWPRKHPRSASSEPPSTRQCHASGEDLLCLGGRDDRGGWFNHGRGCTSIQQAHDLRACSVRSLDRLAFPICARGGPSSPRSDMQDKFQQINEFLKLLGHTRELERLAEGRTSAPHAVSTGSLTAGVSSARPLCILDCGCGSSHLTFGTYHYMSSVLGLPTCIMGVDTNAALMQKSNDFW